MTADCSVPVNDESRGVAHVYPPNDQVIDPERVTARFAEFGSTPKRLIAVVQAGDPSNHVLAGAILSPANTEPLADSILAFVRPLLATHALAP